MRTLLLLSLSLTELACANSKPAAEAAYTTELLQCVDRAKTRAEADACKKGVDAKWGVDAGNPIKDAGGEQ